MDITWIVGHLLGVAVGLSLGLIGGGGSILAVPILVYVLNVEPKSAIAMSLVIVGAVSLLGIIPHWQQQNVNLKIALIFAPTAMIGSYLGARIATLPFISGTLQLIAFAVMMLMAGILMIRDTHLRNPSPEIQLSMTSTTLSTSAPGSTVEKKHGIELPAWILIPLEGLGVGILTGFVGIGGGFAIIPALVLLGKTPMKEAIGTSLIIIAFKSVTGFLGYINHVSVDWILMGSFTVAASFGTVGGAYLTQFIHPKHLQQWFGYFVIAVAIFMLVKR
jgi:uncharacterized membrane protein YfcA